MCSKTLFVSGTSKFLDWDLNSTTYKHFAQRYNSSTVLDRDIDSRTVFRGGHFFTIY